MTAILWFSAALVALSALAGLWVVARSAGRRLRQSRLEGQAERVRLLLESARKDESAGLDKLLFDLRRNYDSEALGGQLQRALEVNVERGESIEPIAKAFRRLGLVESYRGQVRNAKAWRDRAQAARVLGMIRDAASVQVLLEAMRDEREDADVKLAAAEALTALDDPSVIPVLCAELSHVDEWSSPRLAALLERFGAEAVAALLATLDSAESPNARIWAAQILGKIGDHRATQPLIGRLHDRSPQMRMSAASALGDVGDLRAVRPLIDIVLRDPVAAVRAQAAASLGRIGDADAVPVLVGCLGDPEYWMRFRALEAIEALAPEDTSPIEAALEDTNPEVRLRAALALERLGRLEAAFAALDSGDPAVVEAARIKLIAVGRAGLSERFIRHLTDPIERVRANICHVLGAAGERRHAQQLAARLGDESREVRLAAIGALGDLGSGGTAAAIVSQFEEKDAEVREGAADALRRFQAEDLDSIGELLVQKLASQSDATRWCALRVLAILPGASIDQTLIRALQDRFVEVRYEAVRALGDRRVVAAVDAIGASLADAHEPLCVAAADALGAIGGERALSLLLTRVRSAGRAQRDAICRGIAKVGFDALGPVLDVLLGTNDTNARVAAAWTLGKTADPDAVPLLSALLEDGAAEVRSSAAGALGKIHVPDSARALGRAVRDPSPFVRAAVVNAIGYVGEEGDLVALADCLADPDAFVRNRAAISVGLIGTAWAYAELVATPPGSVSAAFMVIALGLTGVPDAVGAAVSLLAAQPTRAAVAAALEREPDRIRERFAANVKLGARDADDSMDPEQLAERIIRALKNSQEPLQRRRAVAALSNIPTERATTAVLEAARNDPDVDVRLRAVGALAERTGTAEVDAVLLDCVLDPAPTVRVEAIRAAGSFAHRDQAGPLFESLRAADEAVVLAAEHALSHVYRDSVLHLLDWMMGQTRPSLIASSLRIVERIADSRSLGLLQHLVTGSAVEVRVEAALALAALHDVEAVRVLMAALDDPVERVRASVVTALARSSRNDVMDRFDKLRLDPSVMVRTALATSLFQIKNTRALDVLERLATDQHLDVRAAAFHSLLACPDLEGQHRFLALWSDLDNSTRRRVEAGTADLADQLEAQLATSLDSPARELAVRVLASLGAGVHGERIAIALGDPDPRVRLVAIEALSTLDADRISDWLANVIDDPVAKVRTAARRLLVKLV